MTDISELRGKSADELKDMAQSLKKELFNLRFQRASGEFSNTSRFAAIRKDIARVKTLLNQPKDAPAIQAKPAKAEKTKPAVAKTSKKISAKKKESGE